MPERTITESCTLSPSETVSALEPSDSFLFSTSEFVTPGTKAVYVKNKGAYLLFRMPEITSTLVPQMSIWFTVTCFNLRATLTFKGEIYKILTQDQTSFPCIIIKVATPVSAEPAQLEAMVTNCEIPLIWRKTGSMKQGSIIMLTPTGGTFDTAVPAVQVQIHIWLNFTIEGLQFEDMEAVVDRVSRKTDPQGLEKLDVTFSFVNQTDSMKDSLSDIISSISS